MTPQEKKELRKVIRQRLDALKAEERELSTQKIYRQIEAEEKFRQARSVLLYWSIGNELSTQSFIEKWSGSKQIYLPVVKGDDLEVRLYRGAEHLKAGAYGILEPDGEALLNYENIDLCLVPGIAFDQQGNRMGHGKGYYDRLLSRVKAYKIGLCFPQQRVEILDAEEWDIPMQKVID